MTPGKQAKQSLAGALNLATDELFPCLGPRKTHALIRDLLTVLDHTYPEPWVTRLSVVVDHYGMQQAKAVAPWLNKHP
jgi:hypothetical protein